MKPILAVATLDLRRLWMPAGFAGVALGLFPGLTRGLAVHASAQDTFPFALGIAAVIAGATVVAGATFVVVTLSFQRFSGPPSLAYRSEVSFHVPSLFTVSNGA